jgi:hypothetical protein
VQSVFDNNEPKAIRDLFKIGRDTTGNLPPLPAIFPDQVAPVVRMNEGERYLTMMFGVPQRWRRWLKTLKSLDTGTIG